MKKYRTISKLVCILCIYLCADMALAIQPAYLSNLPEFGPFDYTDSSTWKHIDVVEKYHFDEGVRSFRRGLNGSVWGDITYTLRAFPNHHPALEAMARLLRQKNRHMSYERKMILYRGMPANVKAEAYFEKAMKFSPNDAKTVLLYGIHLHKTNNLKKALEQYNKAEKMGLLSADLFYNLGLLHVELGSKEKALEKAKKAYALGHPLPGLRNKLKRMGVWKE